MCRQCTGVLTHTHTKAAAAAVAGMVTAVVMEWNYREKSGVRSSTDDTIPTHHHEEEQRDLLQNQVRIDNHRDTSTFHSSLDCF